MKFKKHKFNNKSRRKDSSAILMPLIFSSLDRIDTISCAMELRAFGNGKKRTWYNSCEFRKYDYIAVTIGILIFITSLCMTFKNGSRFYNPF